MAPGSCVFCYGPWVVCILFYKYLCFVPNAICTTLVVCVFCSRCTLNVCFVPDACVPVPAPAPAPAPVPCRKRDRDAIKTASPDFSSLFYEHIQRPLRKRPHRNHSGDVPRAGEAGEAGPADQRNLKDSPQRLCGQSI